MPRIKAPSLDAHHDLMWEALLGSFNELLIDRGLEQITLRDVAERAGMARNTVYNYVKDKNELAAAAARLATQALADQVIGIAESSGPAAERLEKIVTTILTELEDPPVRAALTLGTTGRDTYASRWRAPFDVMFDRVQRVVEEGISTGEFPAVDDAELATDLLSGLIGAGASRIARNQRGGPELAGKVVGAMLRVLGAGTT